MTAFTPSEMMTIAAARALDSKDVCFVGIGAPSAACNVARLTHAPDITLIYESGTIGTAPDVLPLSIGDGELCETAVSTVSVPEMFRYWLQGGRVSVGFLGAAQIDKYGNINTTVIGDYNSPKVRLPGGGGAPEIATSCREIYITLKQATRAMGNKIDFFTSPAIWCSRAVAGPCGLPMISARHLNRPALSSKPCAILLSAPASLMAVERLRR